MSEKTVEMIIQEIERRLKNIPNFHGSSFDDQDMGKEQALESLLTWITEKEADEND